MSRHTPNVRLARPLILSTPVAALVLALGLALSGCEDSVAVTPPPAPQAAPVTVAEVLSKPLRDWHEFTGRLEAESTVELRPRVSGYVDRVAFTEGARVKAGELLFAIDARPFRAEVARLAAERDRAAAELKLAQGNAARGQRLLPQRAIAQEEADRLTTLAVTAQSALAASEAALTRARLDLEFTEVRAPVSGHVSRALITAGNLVTPESVLTTVVADERIHAYFDVDEQTFLRVGNDTGNARVQMGLASDSGYPHAGRIDFVDNRVDARTGTIRVRALFDNADGRYTPGLYARVRLLGPELRDTVLIEDRAIGTDLDRRFVLVLGADGTVAYRAVRLGPQIDGLRVVTDGLAAGDTIVVNGLQRVRPGAKVAATHVSMQLDDGGATLKQIAGDDGATDDRPAAHPAASRGPTRIAVR